MTIETVLKETTNLILDTSVLIGYFSEENLSITPLLDTYVFSEASNITLYGHNLLKTEIYYITCRKKGITEAKNILNKVESIINIIGESWLFEKAGQIKCKYSIAFSDCFSLDLLIFSTSILVRNYLEFSLSKNFVTCSIIEIFFL